MAELDAIADLDAEVAALNETLGQAGELTASFDQELRAMRDAVEQNAKHAQKMTEALQGGVRNAMDGIIKDGASVSDAFRDIATSMIDAAYDRAVSPVSDTIGAVLGGVVNAVLPFEKGAPFTQGRIMPFAKGGVVSGPVTFPMRGATGLMGEAGPEAIMPLTRGADGRLGVQAQGGGGRPVTVVMNIQTPDVQGFQRSQSQIATQVSRMLGQGQRNR